MHPSHAGDGDRDARSAAFPTGHRPARTGPVWARDFTDLRYEWRRGAGEVAGTFLLVLAGAGLRHDDSAPRITRPPAGHSSGGRPDVGPGSIVLAPLVLRLLQIWTAGG